MGRKDVRSYNWCFVAYPDSVPENWIMILRQTHCAFAVSPLHDADVNGDDTEKKNHWHVMFNFDSLKSYSQVNEFAQSVNATIPKVVISPRGLYRYFCHLDNPEKAPYDPADIQEFNGFDGRELIKKTTTEKHKILKDILKFCRDNEITEFSYLIDICIETYDEWFDLLAENYTMFLSSYLKSRRYQRK